MKVIGKDIGTALDELYQRIESRVRIEAEREIRIGSFEGGAFSNVSWGEEGVVVISLHNGVPTHALPHVFGVALQHVRQRLDLYPTVSAGPQQAAGAGMIRSALRELVLAPEAEEQLAPLDLDMTWELEQRHEGLKQMLHEAPEEWAQPGTPGSIFAILQYARFAIEHPPEMWDPLRKTFEERLAPVVPIGEEVRQIVQRHGWATPAACLDALVGVRDRLALQPVALVEDRRTGRTY
jgi:hypothetical protein